MEALALQRAVLDVLEVTTTAMDPADLNFHIFQEWCNGTAVARAELLLNQNDLTSVLYWNQDLNFQVTSMIADPAERSQRRNWCIRQYGTHLSQRSEPV